MKFIILILAALGDTLFTTPALRALRKGYPDAEIDVIVWENNKEILVGNNNIDRLIACRGKGQLISEIQTLREQVYDYAIGLSTAGSYLTYLVNARKKVGFKGKEMNWLYDLNVPDDRRIHAVNYCLEIVKHVGGKSDSFPVMELAISDDIRKSVAKKLENRGIKGELPVLAVHPGGKYFTLKRWPTQKFKDLIITLDNKYNLQVIIIGGKDDRELAEEIIDYQYRYNNKPAIMAGELSIKETGALLEKVDLFLGNDSAPLHMASAVGTPVVGLFGPTSRANFHPYGTDYRIVSSNLSCSPCFTWLGELKQYLPEYLPDWATKCKGNCMEKINVEEVVKAIEVFLNQEYNTKGRKGKKQIYVRNTI